MCINHIITCLIYFADSFLRLFFGAIISIEILQLGFHLRCNSIFTALGKIFHEFCTLLRISACNAIDQALQIAGNQNIHRWRTGKDKVSLSIVCTCGEKIKQNLVLVRSTNQLVHRKSHLFCIKCCQNVSKISCRNYYIDLLSSFNLVLAHQCSICIYIINDLGNKTSNINGVCRRELESSLGKLCCQFFIIEHFLYSCLGIVKITCDAHNISIGTFLGYHLFLLDRAYAMLRIKYNNPGSRNIGKTCKCCFSSISGGRSQDNDFIFYIILSCCSRHKIWQNGKCHVFKCNCRTMEKFQIICPVSFLKRCDHICVKLLVICSVDTSAQLFFCKVSKKAAHYLISSFLISHSGKFIHRNIKCRNLCWYKQSSIFRKSL